MFPHLLWCRTLLFGSGAAADHDFGHDNQPQAKPAARRFMGIPPSDTDLVELYDDGSQKDFVSVVFVGGLYDFDVDDRIRRSGNLREPTDRR